MLRNIFICTMLSIPVFAVNCFAYNDVGADDQYYTQISELSDAGIINGYDDDTFRANAPITRSEFAKLFCGAMDINEGSNKKYTDVDTDFWGAKYINALSSAGIINGYEDGIFRPNDNICFKDAVKMAVCAKDLTHINMMVALAYGIFSGLSLSTAAPLTYEQAEQIIDNSK